MPASSSPVFAASLKLSNAKPFIRAAYWRTLVEGLRPNVNEESGSIKLIALENHWLAAKTEEAEGHEAICVVDLVKDRSGSC